MDIHGLMTIHIKNGDWEAWIAPDYGMNTLALLWRDIPVLRSPKSMDEFLGAPETFGTPALIPASRTEGARFSFEGKEYGLPCNEPARNTHKHGILHKTAFTICSMSDNSVYGKYRNTGNCFPFPFDIFIGCELGEDGYRQQFTVENTGVTNMPLIFAIHAAFVKPETVRVPIEQRWVLTERVLPTGELVPLDEFEQAILKGCTLDDRRIEGCYTSCGRDARIGKFFYRVSQNFTQWIIWNGSGKQGFLCIEPQSGPINALNMPTCLTVPPGGRIRFSTHIGKTNGN
jgi:aldose 1-epimerase